MQMVHIYLKQSVVNIAHVEGFILEIDGQRRYQSFALAEMRSKVSSQKSSEEIFFAIKNASNPSWGLQPFPSLTSARCSV